MEHILQVAFQFDDEAVKKRLEDQCFREVVDRIVNEYKSVVGERYRYSGWDPYASKEKKIEDRFHQAVCDDVLEGVNDFCIRHKDEIIDLAASKIADKLSRTKKAKEILNEL